jgi:hypothetical protein
MNLEIKRRRFKPSTCNTPNKTPIDGRNQRVPGKMVTANEERSNSKDGMKILNPEDERDLESSLNFRPIRGTAITQKHINNNTPEKTDNLTP